MQAEEKARQNNQGWFAYFFGSSKSEDEKRSINDDELQKLYAVLQANMGSSDSEPPHMARTDEYYWLVGDFSLAKGVVKIQRDTPKPDKATFKEAIVLTLENICAKVQKRFKGFDMDARISSTVLSTYSSLGKKNRISDVVISRNLVGAMTEEERAKKAEEALVEVKIAMFPPNTDVQLEVGANVRSVRVYYLPLLIGRMMMFLGREEARSQTFSALSTIKSNAQDSVQAALEGKKAHIVVSIESPVMIVPILKNNDPASPVWRIKLGDIHINSNVTKPGEKLTPIGGHEDGERRAGI